MDGVYTGIESAIHGSYKPSGVVALGTSLALGNGGHIGEAFDLVAGEQAHHVKRV